MIYGEIIHLDRRSEPLLQTYAHTSRVNITGTPGSYQTNYEPYKAVIHTGVENPWRSQTNGAFNDWLTVSRFSLNPLINVVV